MQGFLYLHSMGKGNRAKPNPRKPLFFMSDAHLGKKNDESRTDRQEKLLRFFHFVQRHGEGLCIVGDLFDFWFEYRSVIPRHHFQVCCALKALTESGVRVDYVTGNHDFGLDVFFESELRIRVHREPWEMVRNGKRYYISHGDGIAKKDIGYRILKRILRHRGNQRLYRLIHPDLGFSMALFFSNISRNRRTVINRDQEYIDYARARFADGFDGVVMAHTHNPCEFHQDDHTYINTGDWMHHYSYAELDGDRLRLKYWNQNTMEPDQNQSSCI